MLVKFLTAFFTTMLYAEYSKRLMHNEDFYPYGSARKMFAQKHNALANLLRTGMLCTCTGLLAACALGGTCSKRQFLVWSTQ